jgi:hypothetical protein
MAAERPAKADLRSQARARQQRRRERLVASGIPTTHAVNRAVAEALLFCAEQNMRAELPRSQTTVEFGAVVAHASLILIVGNGQSPVYDVSQVHRVMRERFRRRPRAWTIKPFG